MKLLRSILMIFWPLAMTFNGIFSLNRLTKSVRCAILIILSSEQSQKSPKTTRGQQKQKAKNNYESSKREANA